jgi:hypothetical protein
MIIIAISVWFGQISSICVLPEKDIRCNDKVIFIEKVKFTGKAIYSGLAVKDKRSCALYCMWSEEKCTGISFEVSNFT